MFNFWFIASALWGCAMSAPAGTEAPGTTDGTLMDETAARAQAKDCHNVMSKVAQGQIIFQASDVFECLKNVPFSVANANRFIEFYSQTLQYQSTLAYLANPPPGYQQPPVNIQDGLSAIQAKINAGEYTSQYAFEAEVHHLINRMHDNHVSLEAGILAAFSFASPYSLVSASSDGKQAPEIYLYEDAVFSQLEGWNPSPITQINGKDAVEYLAEHAALNSEGFVESNADWNSLMDSPVRDIQFGLSLFQRSTFYPGNELDFAFANGSTLNTEWLAIYTSDMNTGPMSTPGDFFNYFVLGMVPSGYDPEAPTQWWSDNDILNDTLAIGDEQFIDESEVEQAAQDVFGCPTNNTLGSSWCSESSGAYPSDPVVAQSGLGVSGTGVVTGYIFDDISTAVLSIPSFFMLDQEITDFDAAIEQFIGNATARKSKQLIIDLQQNSGGMSLLAFTLFKRLFNGLEPYTGSRIRSHEAANILGTAYSEWWKSLETDGTAANASDYQNLADNEWVIHNRINPETGRNYSSWQEYFGPVQANGDNFSRQQLYNLTDPLFNAALFEWLPLDFINEDHSLEEFVWNAEDIVILTDGTCSSACSLFVELMTHQAGVRTITVGGMPTPGPMQTASGTRGARFYTDGDLLTDYEFLIDTIGDESALSRLPNRDDTGIFLDFLSFNIRDQMREGEEIPLQFKYDAAQCRIYYTLGNVYNMTQLWRDAAAATWEDPSLCVQNSTGYATRPDTTETTINPPPEQIPQVPTLNLENVKDAGFLINSTGGLVNFPVVKGTGRRTKNPGTVQTAPRPVAPPVTAPVTRCRNALDCTGVIGQGAACRPFPFSCSAAGQTVRQPGSALICFAPPVNGVFKGPTTAAQTNFITGECRAVGLVPSPPPPAASLPKATSPKVGAQRPRPISKLRTGRMARMRR
ncbi:unnamed protein product [Periconia digitata]|uniref:Tail specific protease domain-containing protein n=1 Tax=Periconia digitata TaxID=1303443 RepID=A0A9W4UDA5_9PLEO|nr:unnamed protein product [Periconia digitata]